MSKQQDDRDKLWASMFQRLLEFKSEEGHARVPSTWHDKTLAKWVSRQRENENVMLPDRKKKLNSIGFSWYADMQQLEEELWMDKYEQLKIFRKKYGHFQVPKAEKQYQFLRPWVDKQRATEKSMPAHRKEMLDTIKFRWNKDIKADVNDNWNAMYKELVDYYKMHGDCRVSYHSTEYPQLGAWVSRQRKRWTQLDTRKKKKLEELGFITSSDIEKEKRQKWLTMLAILKRYKKEHGHCRVPSLFSKNPELGRWVEVQRLEEKSIADWKKEKLTALGFEWSKNIQDNKERRWYAMYEKLEKFYKRYGHSRVPEYWKTDPKLAIWVSYQRKPKSPLAKEKIDLLNQLNFLWNPRRGAPRKRDEFGQFINEV